MKTYDFFKFVQEEIHSTVVATVDDEGLPVTCAIDIMDYDENSLYFLTAKGKNFYNRLKSRKYMALTGMKGEDTMSCVSISIRGKVRELGTELLQRLLEKNPYMNDIYPDKESQRVLTVFQLYEGSGEWFDLSKKPIERMSFTFGDAKVIKGGYYINNKCKGCNLCHSICPQKCIDINAIPAVIKQKNCLKCGNCYEICPSNAVEKRVESVFCN